MMNFASQYRYHINYDRKMDLCVCAHVCECRCHELKWRFGGAARHFAIDRWFASLNPVWGTFILYFIASIILSPAYSGLTNDYLCS